MTTGTDDADLIIGTNASEFIYGKGGNDVIFGNGGVDWLLGQEGDDILNGGRGSDIIYGGDGIDTANYNDASFDIHADLVTGKVSVDVGGQGETDTLIEIENVTGGGGNDQISGNDLDNVLQGMNGHDNLHGRGGNDKLYGGAGNDSLSGDAGADILDGGQGVDEAAYVNSDAAVNINLTTHTAYGGHANGDILIDIEDLFGSDYNDTLVGDGKSNSLSGSDGDDILKGLDGDDKLFGGDGADVLDGGEGVDIAYYIFSTGAVHIDLQQGTASGGSAEGDTLIDIENLLGGGFGDTLAGNQAANDINGLLGDDIILGRGGKDTLKGSDGDDRINGGGGADLIAGDAGADKLTGGAGADTFTFTNWGDSWGSTAATRDKITDFARGIDKIAIEFDANRIVSGVQHFAFVDDSAFSGNGGELRAYSTDSHTIIEADTNADGVADFQIELIGVINLTAGDFIL